MSKFIIVFISLALLVPVPVLAFMYIDNLIVASMVSLFWVCAGLPNVVYSLEDI